ncbi:hypothetical protein K505DRAFT_418159 [Melanomma pulvis-pyrius CBS 109.77]|uniref:C2H2-type domain-containing protein n=1 Tax=Melanomma pulvis-pyrius CBS 109.77 TaxID=1314802 RepID=A0A6A6XAW7_9PLEO|nr:hypothetical protein K505DRAFT_418159 [Melanomma pulvis-pyrius CBS 109.77]
MANTCDSYVSATALKSPVTATQASFSRKKEKNLKKASPHGTNFENATKTPANDRRSTSGDPGDSSYHTDLHKSSNPTRPVAQVQQKLGIKDEWSTEQSLRPSSVFSGSQRCDSATLRHPTPLEDPEQPSMPPFTYPNGAEAFLPPVLSSPSQVGLRASVESFERRANSSASASRRPHTSTTTPANESNRLLFITGNTPAELKSKKNMTKVRKKAMSNYLEKEKKPRTAAAGGPYDPPLSISTDHSTSFNAQKARIPGAAALSVISHLPGQSMHALSDDVEVPSSQPPPCPMTWKTCSPPTSKHKHGSGKRSLARYLSNSRSEPLRSITHLGTKSKALVSENERSEDECAQSFELSSTKTNTTQRNLALPHENTRQTYRSDSLVLQPQTTQRLREQDARKPTAGSSRVSSVNLPALIQHPNPGLLFEPARNAQTLVEDSSSRRPRSYAGYENQYAGYEKQYEGEEKRKSLEQNSGILQDDGLSLRVKVSPEAQHIKSSALYPEDGNSSQLKIGTPIMDMQQFNGSKHRQKPTSKGSVLSQGSKTHHILRWCSSSPNNNQSVKLKRELISTGSSKSLPSHLLAASSKTINKEPNRSKRIRQNKPPRPNNGHTDSSSNGSDGTSNGSDGTSNGSGDDANNDERGIEDVAVSIENSDEFVLKTEIESEEESEEELQGYQDDVERSLDAAILGVKNILRKELSKCASFEAIDNSDYSNTQSSSSRSQGSTVPLSSNAPHHPQRRKRLRGGGRDLGNGGDDEDDEDDRPKKRNEKNSPDRLPQRRLKCPFYQRQPEKYARAACRGEGFADMAKLKDHIKRVHTQPLRCSRCWQEMKSDDAYMKHLQKETICKKGLEPLDDRIRPQMLKNLDFKKVPYAHARNTEEKWKILYSVLFPNENDIPSPYDQHGMSPRFERVLYEALEEELTKELAPVLAPILLRIKDRIPAIVENCRLRLMRMSPDIEVMYTPSGSVSTIDSEQASQKLGPEPTSRATSRCSRSSFGELTSSGVLQNKAYGKRPQRSGTSLSDSSIEELQEPRHTSSPESSPDRSMLDLDTANSSQLGWNKDSIDLSTRNSSLFAVPCSFPVNSIDGIEKRNPTHDKDQRIGLNKLYEYPQAAIDEMSPQYRASDLSWDLIATLDPQGDQNQNGYAHGCDPLLSSSDWNYLPDDFDFSQFFNDQ